MIHGLTTRTQLAIATKFAIGLPKNHKEHKGYPQKLDYFMAETKNVKGEWVEDESLEELLRRKYSREVDGKFTPLREFDVVFLSDDIEEVFKTEYAMWSASEKQCSGDGLKAMRALSIIQDKAILDENKGQRYAEWTPCGDTCPEKIAKKCKPSGSLYFMLLDKPVLGSVSVFFTTSYRSVLQIHSSLTQIKELTGGRLKGIPLRIVLRPGKTSYQDPKNGERKTSNAFFVNIEFRHADHSQILPALLNASIQADKARISQINELKKIGAPQKMIAEYVEDVSVSELPDEEAGAHMAGHFFSEDDLPEDGDNDPVVANLSTIDAICKAWGISQARRDVVLGTFQGNVETTTAWFEDASKQFNRLGLTPQGVSDLFQHFGMRPAELLKHVNGLPDRKTPAEPQAETPRRTRRTKAQMEADAAAARDQQNAKIVDEHAATVKDAEPAKEEPKAEPAKGDDADPSMFSF